MSARVYRIEPRSNDDGTFASVWVDSPDGGWNDERLDKQESILADWRPISLSLFGSHPATSVLFNPNVFAVSESVRSALAGLSEVEFLPIHVEDVGTYHLMHVLAAIDPPEGTELRRVGEDGNVVEIHGFPWSFHPAEALFRVRQPPDSPAGRAGFVHSAIFANARGASLIRAACGEYLDLIPC